MNLESSTLNGQLHAAGRPGLVLKHQAVILRAPLIKDENSPMGRDFRIVSINDFPEAGYLSPPERTIRVQSMLDKAEKYRLEPYDLLLTIVGTIGKTAILPEHMDEPWIPSSNMLIIRFRDDKWEKAITFLAFLKSNYGTRLLEELTHGRTIPIVSKKEFSSTTIPAFEHDLVEKGKHIFEKEVKIAQERQHLADQIATVRAQFLE
ncbi:MAG: hypothetical protein EA428_11095 [Spirochaetaceae bacterium]|nr:MAG: hypothetical protein EA428_11095 [Spirochaetaceae bacterium]